MRRRRVLSLGLLPAMALCLCGCATPMERHGIADAAIAERASVLHMASVRFWGDEAP